MLDSSRLEAKTMSELELLLRCPFFDALTQRQLQSLAALADEVHQPADKALFYEGQPADTIWLVLGGRVGLRHAAEGAGVAHTRTTEAIYHLIEEGAPIPMLEGQSEAFAEISVGEIGPGEILGISALIPPYQRTATARALVSSRLLRLDAVALREACAQDYSLERALLRATAQAALQRLHVTRQQLIFERH